MSENKIDRLKPPKQETNHWIETPESLYYNLYLKLLPLFFTMPENGVLSGIPENPSTEISSNESNFP